MDRDELRDAIITLLDAAEIIIKAPPEFYAMKSKVTLKIDGKAGIADDILSLIAPELEKARLFILNKDYIDRFYSEAEELRTNAEKWRKVSSLVEGDCNSCKSLRYCEKNDIHPCEILKDALEGEVKG